MTRSWGDGASSGRIIHPAVQVSRLHDWLHRQLGGSVSAGHGLSHHRGEQVAGSVVKLPRSGSDCPLFSAETSARLLFPHISPFLRRLWALFQVPRPGDPEPNGPADRCRVSEDAQQTGGAQARGKRREATTRDQVLNN